MVSEFNRITGGDLFCREIISIVVEIPIQCFGAALADFSKALCARPKLTANSSSLLEVAYGVHHLLK